MLDFNRFNQGLGITTAGVVVLLALTMTGLSVPNSINITILVFLGLTALSVTMLGLILLWSNGKHWKEAYSTERLLAEFARELLKPGTLGTGASLMHVFEVLIVHLKKEPAHYRDFFLGLQLETLEQIEILCRKKRVQLWRDMGLEGQNPERSGNELRLEKLQADLQSLEGILAQVGTTAIIVKANQGTNKPTQGNSSWK